MTTVRQYSIGCSFSLLLIGHGESLDENTMEQCHVSNVILVLLPSHSSDEAIRLACLKQKVPPVTFQLGVKVPNPPCRCG